MEFLGPPGLNKNHQQQIQALYYNVASISGSYFNPFGHWIRVRCDDIGNRCENKGKEDPCLPTSVTSHVLYSLMAYSSQPFSRTSKAVRNANRILFQQRQGWIRLHQFLSRFLRQTKSQRRYGIRVGKKGATEPIPEQLQQ